MKNSDVLKELSDIVPRHQDWPDDWVMARKPVKRRYSVIYKLYSPSRKKFVFAKSSVKEDAAKEYRLQEKYFSGINANLAVLKPYGHTPNGIVVSEWVDAPTVKKLLIRNVFAGQSRKRLMLQVAAWMKWFHSYSEHKTYDHNQLNHSLRLKLKRLIKQKKNICTDKKLLRKCYDVLTANKAITKNLKLKACIIHGDAKPSNFFYTGSKLIGFDYKPEFYGPVTTDVFRFLSHVDLCRPFFTKSQIISPAFREFLTAYDPKICKLDDKVILYLYLLTIVDRLAAINIHIMKRRNKLSHRFVLLRLEHIANYLCRQL